MAKTKTLKSTAAMALKRYNVFKAWLRQEDVAPYVREERYNTDPWVWHDKDNLYPERLRQLVDNCGPLERCVTMLSEFIAGDGIRFYDKDGNEMEDALAFFQQLVGDSSEEEFLQKTAYDLAHGLGFAWTVRRSATGEIVRLDHLDRFGLRSGMFKDDVIERNGVKVSVKRVMEYWYSHDWQEYCSNASDDRFKPYPIPAFNPEPEGKKHPMEVVFVCQPRPREPYYGRVFWQGAWNAAVNWTKVDEYNRTQIDCGFSPAVLLGLRISGSEKEQDDAIGAVQSVFTGASGNPIMPFPLGPDEKEPFVQVLERGNHAGELDNMRSGSADVIYDSFGIPSLLLRDREAGLTSQERAIHMRLQQMQRTLVASLQKLPGRTLTQIMNLCGFEVWETKFSPLKIFDIVQSDATKEATTSVDEARAERGLEAWPDVKYGAMSIAHAKSPPQLQVDPKTGKPMNAKPDEDEDEELEDPEEEPVK